MVQLGPTLPISSRRESSTGKKGEIFSPAGATDCVNCRGVSFAIGQTGNWQTVTTLPNILKQFNPRFVQNFFIRIVRGINTSIPNFTWEGLKHDYYKTLQVYSILNRYIMFNGRIVGGSTNIGGENDAGSNLNLASPGATSVNLTQQAA